MSVSKSTESPGSDCGVPAQRSSQQGPEMVSVKLEDCSQTLELNVIVKEEWEERGIKEEREVKEEVENREVSAPDQEEEEEAAVDSITDPGESYNPGSDSEPSSTASGNHKQHRLRNSRQKHHHCMDCFTSFCDPEELRRHTCRPHPCSDCRDSFICPTHLVQHKQTLKTKKPYMCGQCGKRFQTPSTLKTHQLTHTGKKPFHCSHCGKTFDSSLHLKRHHKIHTGEKPFHCAQCGKSFSDEGNHNKHQRIHTGEKTYQCSECGKSFNQLSHLKAHQQTHTGDNLFHCSPCGKGFSLSSNLKRHQLMDKDKPYHCSHCRKSFRLEGCLQSHQRIHSGEKPHHCSQCGKSFNQAGNLKTHQRIHSGEKPYHCSQCGKTFSRAGRLNEHLKYHTGEKPYHCDQYGKSFHQMAEKSRAPVWDHYIELAPGKARCLICDKDISMGSAMAKFKNTTNLWNHLKNIHPNAHKEAMMKKANANSSQGKSDTDTSQTSQATLLQLFNKHPKWQDKDPKWQDKDPEWQDKDPEWQDKDPKWQDKDPKWQDKDPKWQDKDPKWQDKDPKWQDKDPKWQDKDPKWQDKDPKWQDKDPKWQDKDPKWQDKDPKWQDKDPKWQDKDPEWQDKDPKWQDKDPKWQDKDPRAKKMDEAIIEMIATDNQPFTVVSDVGFQRLITLAEPLYRIKDETFFRTEMLDKTHERVVMKVKNLVAPGNAPHMAFTTDCWSGTTESLMSLTGHFIDDVWTRKLVVLNVKTMTGSHAGNYIREMFLTTLEHWDIHTERVVLVLRDSGANMMKGVRLAELPDFSCSAHTLQLVINDGLSSQRAVLNIIAMLESCSTHFDHSVLAKQRLRAIQEELGLPKHSLIQTVQTRWNSTLHMLQRMFEQRRALNAYAGEYGHISSLFATQWDIVSNLIETLAPMEEVTVEMSHSNSTAACIIPSVSVLKLMLQQEGSSTQGINTLRKTMLDSLTRRFSKAEETKCLVLATVLDPRYKSYAFASGTALEKAKEWLKEESDLLRKPNPRATAERTSEEEDTDQGAKRQRVQIDQPPSLVDSLYARILGSQQGRAGVQCSFDIELERYLTEPVIDRKSGLPLEWWKQNEDRFQSLAPLAKKFLCPPSSSVPSEKVFSEVGNIYDKWRSRLTGDQADKLCFLHHNLKLLNWDY
ncbi:uncharacterized protein LOC116364351 isoform X2 [Oncorhynchus kisutch]|nr:uncharacterized protein LOC116364351 isoform X2 [Oncorhynchus kisutch]XP_031673380.1 uncharacterized protein LOC116364351 isoform X2 [Oncorhynchus kisutch]